MKKDKLTDEMIAQAVSEYVELWLASLPEFEEHKFSPQYKANMAKLLRKMERREKMQRFIHRTVAVFLVLVFGLSSIVSLIPDVRAEFVNWVRTTYEESVIFRLRGDEAAAALPVCELTWIPEGYELLRSRETEHSYTEVYEDDNGMGLIFSCKRMTQNSYMQIGVNESLRSEKIYFNKQEAELFFGEDGDTMLVWIDDAGFVFTISGTIEKIVILHIAEGVKISK